MGMRNFYATWGHQESPYMDTRADQAHKTEEYMMNITVQHTEVGRYALIATTPGSNIELLLDDALPTPQSLRRHAEARRRDATPKSHILAALIDDAADRYESGIQ
jgi:3-methyladenine DNA glycosylase AlkC